MLLFKGALLLGQLKMNLLIREVPHCCWCCLWRWWHWCSAVDWILYFLVPSVWPMIAVCLSVCLSSARLHSGCELRGGRPAIQSISDAQLLHDDDGQMRFQIAWNDRPSRRRHIRQFMSAAGVRCRLHAAQRHDVAAAAENRRDSRATELREDLETPW